MRLWHEDLIPYLPRQQLLGQHRECCALRGNGWGKPHATVNYVFDHPVEWLWAYHIKVIGEMTNRGFNPDLRWTEVTYCGRNKEEHVLNFAEYKTALDMVFSDLKVYPEHDDAYLAECLENLRRKGIDIEFPGKE